MSMTAYRSSSGTLVLLEKVRGLFQPALLFDEGKAALFVELMKKATSSRLYRCKCKRTGFTRCGRVFIDGWQAIGARSQKFRSRSSDCLCKFCDRMADL